MISFEVFYEHLKRVEDEIGAMCRLVGREEGSVKLLPVTKTYPGEVVEYVARVGLWGVGENRVLEAVEKKQGVKGELKWELIGHLQTNKVGLAVRCFDRIQSVDSEKLLRKIDHEAGKVGKLMRVLLQVNAGEDPAKYGVSCEGVRELLEVGLSLKCVRIEGLMTIGELSEDRAIARKTFRRLRTVRDQLEEEMGVELRELSMGMSHDFKEAIEEGSTLVRIGRGLFGGREG